MPTLRPLHQITETPPGAQAIDLAAHRWPGEPRSRLLLRLVDVGKAALDEDQNTAIRKRQAAVK
ncbi:MAG: hypothetical protein ACREP9_02890 [Candidatus Dormibacteraceae bacterium]